MQTLIQAFTRLIGRLLGLRPKEKSPAHSPSISPVQPDTDMPAVTILDIEPIAPEQPQIEDTAMQSTMPVRLILQRGLLRNSTTQIGALHTDAGEFICHVLEDPSRNIKIPDKTAIPKGTYDIYMSTTQGRALRYAARWPWHEKEIFWLQDVPAFTMIQIHVGNYHHDTSGCLLLGVWDGKSGHIGSSVTTYKKFYNRFRQAARDKILSIWIEG